jgi:hypothetical protein
MKNSKMPAWLLAQWISNTGILAVSVALVAYDLISGRHDSLFLLWVSLASVMGSGANSVIVSCG